jgi:hypothetical protein
MRKLDSDQEIRKLAAELKVDWQQNAVQNIIVLCHEKISKWIKGGRVIRSIRELEALICEKLALVFEEVWTDEDLAGLIRKYVTLVSPFLLRSSGI